MQTAEKAEKRKRLEFPALGDSFRLPVSLLAGDPVGLIVEEVQAKLGIRAKGRRITGLDAESSLLPFHWYQYFIPP